MMSIREKILLGGALSLALLLSGCFWSGSQGGDKAMDTQLVDTKKSDDKAKEKEKPEDPLDEKHRDLDIAHDEGIGDGADVLMSGAFDGEGGEDSDDPDGEGKEEDEGESIGPSNSTNAVMIDE